jgi:hypothetical protein
LLAQDLEHDDGFRIHPCCLGENLNHGPMVPRYARQNAMAIGLQRQVRKLPEAL